MAETNGQFWHIRGQSATGRIVDAALDLLMNQPISVPLDPSLPAELQGVIRRTDFKLQSRGHDTDCWIWEPSSRMINDPFTKQRRRIEEVIYHIYFGQTLPRNRALENRCGQDRCINYEHFTVIMPKDRGIIQRLRTRRKTEIDRGAKFIIDKLSKKYGWSENEQSLIFRVSFEQLHEDYSDPVEPASAQGQDGPEILPVVDLEVPPEPDKPSDPKTNQALSVAAEAGDMDLVLRLLELGADPNAQGDHDRTPLHLAAYEGHVEITRVLLASGADPNIRGTDEDTPLHMAVYADHISPTELLLAAGADPNAMDTFGYRPVHRAANNRSMGIMGMLLKAGADPNLATEDPIEEVTPLHIAAMGGKELVEMLLAAGANPNAKDKDGWTPVDQAYEFSGDMEIVRLLLSARRSPPQRDEL